jgi:replication initiation protein RepC
MTYAQTAFTGATGARPITALTRRIMRDLDARAPDAPEITDRAELFRVVKQAAVALGLGVGARETLEHLIGYTRSEDWRADRTPVVWPSNQTLAEMAGRTVGAVKARLRQLRAHGLVLARDSAPGRRTGRRDATGAISSAFGVDLSPLRIRFDELRRLAAAYTAQSRLFAEGRAEIARVRRLVGQALAQAADLRLTGAHWPALTDAIDGVAAVAAAARAGRDVNGFRAALDRLPAVEEQVADTIDQFMFPVDVDGSGSKNQPAIHFRTKPYPSYYVKEDQACSPVPARRHAVPTHHVSSAGDSRFAAAPADLMAMFPATAAYVGRADPRWQEIQAAAARLRHDLGIRLDTYLDSLDRLGPDDTAVAVMITAERHARDEIRRTAGAYFAGMIAKAKRGELDLARSLWGFRDHLGPETRGGDLSRHASRGGLVEQARV